MFVIFATKPLNDGTKGFRFNFLGLKGLTRKRKHTSRGYKINVGGCMKAIHLGKRTVYLEHNSTPRKLRHFAGQQRMTRYYIATVSSDGRHANQRWLTNVDDLTDVMVQYVNEGYKVTIEEEIHQ